jgi:hypothetical protein
MTLNLWSVQSLLKSLITEDNLTKVHFLCLSVLLLLLSSCTDQQDLCSREGILKDMLGADGCTLVIEDSSGDLFVPENISEFGLAFYDRQSIRFSYRLSMNNSPCFQGVPVTLLCVEGL